MKLGRDATTRPLRSPPGSNFKRVRILEHCLSACESLKLQAMLETTTQQNGEAISTYVRRFRPEAQRAYSQQREASEEFRVVSAFLRGFRDRHFAARIFRKGRIGTLAEATTSALELEAEREKMKQMLKVSGQESTEFTVVDRWNDEADQLPSCRNS